MPVTLRTCGAKWNSMLRRVVFMQFTSFLLCWLVTCLLYVYSHLKSNKTNEREKMKTCKNKVIKDVQAGWGWAGPLQPS